MSSELSNDEMALKDRLDAAAKQDHNPPEPQGPTLVEKVAEYVPGGSKLLGTKGDQEQSRQPSSDYTTGPPERPDHDEHIAEFVRDQHRSKKPDGTLTN
ncbi:hypothetical protein GGR57DRAFT_509587 [Xylariaceae sp. FL1272]|nr:hypothetical protein GGR57DRAFT_509587 [Xylariaceae sp. FL1272]